MKHELLQEWLDLVDSPSLFTHNYERHNEVEEEIDLNLKIADRFYEIAPDVWENFKKEILQKERKVK